MTGTGSAAGLLGGGSSSSDDGESVGGLLGKLGGGFGKMGGFLGSLLHFGGFRAEGGGVDPGNAYMVGERGPELWTPPSKGSIIPNNKLGGSVAYYTIDARGTDPVLTEQRTRQAILAAHDSAVSNSLQVSREHLKRTPNH